MQSKQTPVLSRSTNGGLPTETRRRCSPSEARTNA